MTSPASWEICMQVKKQQLKLDVGQSNQIRSGAQSCPTLCDPMNRSTPGLPITNFWSSLKLMSIKLVMPSNHLIFLSSPSPPAPNPSQHQRLFQWVNSSHRWPKYWSFSFSISPSNEHSGLIFRMDGWISLQSKGLSRVFSNTTVQKHQCFGAQLSSQSNSHIHTWPLEKP